MSAELSNGVVVHFAGSADGDSEVCVQRWNGRSYRYLLGFWGNGRFEGGTPQLRDAITKVVGGPVGTASTVALQAPTTGKLWNSATLEHVADSVVKVGHSKRRVVKLRVVRRDALGRADVESERLYWLDRATGIPIKKQTVTRMADGAVSHITTWDVRAMRADNIQAAS